MALASDSQRLFCSFCYSGLGFPLSDSYCTDLRHGAFSPASSDSAEDRLWPDSKHLATRDKERYEESVTPATSSEARPGNLSVPRKGVVGGN